MTEDFNAAALARRASLPAENQFTLQEMFRLPPYFGWVNCSSGLGSFRMLLGGEDDAVALRFFWNGVYEKTTLRLWALFARKVALALDVGAHTGSFTLAAKSANPNVSVACFEPHFMNFARLSINLRANGLATSNSFMKAVGAKNEVLPFSVTAPLDRLSSGGSIGVRSQGQTTMVDVVTIDSVLPEALKSKVGLVKIDTEGYEGACLKGMCDTLHVALPIVFFECITAQSGLEVAAALAPLGYRFFEVDDYTGEITPVTALEPCFDLQSRLLLNRLNRIALPPGVTLPM